MGQRVAAWLNALADRLAGCPPVVEMCTGKQFVLVEAISMRRGDACQANRFQNSITDPRAFRKGMPNVFPKIGAMTC
jgi:hypothetical protein